MISVLILYLLCASSFTIAKAVLAYTAPIFFVGTRMVIAGIALLTFVYAMGMSMRIRFKDRWFFASIIFFHIYFAYIFDLWSLQYISSFMSSFYFNLSPFITALFAYLFLGELLTAKKWLGLCIGFVGFIPLMIHEANARCILPDAPVLWLPQLVLLGSIVSSCIGWVSMKRLIELDYSPLFINGFGMAIGGFLALCTSFIQEQWWHGLPVSAWQPFIILTLLIIIVCNLLFYNLYGYLLRIYSATFLSFAGFLCPLFAAFLGFLLLGESPSLAFFVAATVVSFGLYLFYQDELHA